MAARYGHLIKKWVALGALTLAVMAALLVIQPAWGQDAPPLIPNAETEFTYAENGTRPVTTYRATDPEGNKIFWTLEGTDAASFKIEGGVLSFKSPPELRESRGQAKGRGPGCRPSRYG